MHLFQSIRVAIRGGGDLGSGAAYRLHRAGFSVLITELAHPLLVRRTVSYGSAVIEGTIRVEGITARRVNSLTEAEQAQSAGEIPVLIDATGACLHDYAPAVLLDARMLKTDPGIQPIDTEMVIGMGPGFEVPTNCDAIIETNRGHHLGRVIWQGEAEPDTNVPGKVLDKEAQRVLRAPCDGILKGLAAIGSVMVEGQPIAEISGEVILAPFGGVLRGLVHDGTWVQPHLKIGDIDPRAKPDYAFSISDKALAIGGGVLEAVLTSAVVRSRLGG